MVTCIFKFWIEEIFVSKKRITHGFTISPLPSIAELESSVLVCAWKQACGCIPRTIHTSPLIKLQLMGHLYFTLQFPKLYLVLLHVGNIHVFLWVQLGSRLFVLDVLFEKFHFSIFSLLRFKFRIYN